MKPFQPLPHAKLPPSVNDDVIALAARIYTARIVPGSPREAEHVIDAAAHDAVIEAASFYAVAYDATCKAEATRDVARRAECERRIVHVVSWASQCDGELSMQDVDKHEPCVVCREYEPSEQALVIEGLPPVPLCACHMREVTGNPALAGKVRR